MSAPATLLMWFQLRSPELAEDFERLMTEDRDIVRGSLDTVSDWRLTRPADVPGQAIGQADYVLIAEIVGVERWEQQASEHVQRLADDSAHLVSSPGCSSCVRGPLKSALGGGRSDPARFGAQLFIGPRGEETLPCLTNAANKLARGRRGRGCDGGDDARAASRQAPL